MSEINRIAVVGAETMGGGIAIAAIAAGLPTILVDTKAKMTGRAFARARMYLSRQVEKERINQAEADRAIARLTTSEHIEDVSGSDLVIEAVFEDLSVKTSCVTSAPTGQK